MTAAERKVREWYPDAWAFKARRGEWSIIVGKSASFPRAVGWGTRDTAAWDDAASRLPATPATGE